MNWQDWFERDPRLFNFSPCNYWMLVLSLVVGLFFICRINNLV